MRKQLFAVCFALCAGAATAAHAQFWGLQAPGQAVSGMGVVTFQSRDWVQCTGEEQTPPQRAISACGRIIGERMSRDTTATALYYRSVLYRQADQAARADADVERAVEILRALIEAEPSNTEHLNNLIFLRVQTRNFTAAAQDYEMVAAMQPQALEPRLFQAGFLFRAGDYRTAATVFIQRPNSIPLAHWRMRGVAKRAPLATSRSRSPSKPAPRRYGFRISRPWRSSRAASSTSGRAVWRKRSRTSARPARRTTRTPVPRTATPSAVSA